eukprot:CAMPEP_0204642518 /NCGR_PEP_ID=MMETSP0717-20131115/51727_1 /ASSEMBLY_ACC=CAM_ASM_000666 /TAXON_ID=230516 /ORGANISM="Chaetoceros curvisetus" /LENGTH=132 /DNA_ID=CAMNT_0051663289 /DNA_START=128 /DNA_END=526 /DNA_ORIENTATION=-
MTSAGAIAVCLILLYAEICIGLAICCGGLWLSTKALAKRDEDDYAMELEKRVKTNSSINETSGFDISDAEDMVFGESQVDQESVEVSDAENNEEQNIALTRDDDETELQQPRSAFLRHSKYLGLRHISARLG